MIGPYRYISDARGAGEQGADLGLGKACWGKERSVTGGCDALRGERRGLLCANPGQKGRVANVEEGASAVGWAGCFRCLICSVVVAKLFSSAGTGYTYTFRRPRTSPKFELIKYDPVGKGRDAGGGGG